MGRLVVSKTRQGQGIGKLLVACALERCLKARRDVAGYASLARDEVRAPRDVIDKCARRRTVA